VIRFQCAECSAKIKADDARAGHTVRCPSCRTSLVVPIAAEVGLPATEGFKGSFLSAPETTFVPADPKRRLLRNWDWWAVGAVGPLLIGLSLVLSFAINPLFLFASVALGVYWAAGVVSITIRERWVPIAIWRRLPASVALHLERWGALYLLPICLLAIVFSWECPRGPRPILGHCAAFFAGMAPLYFVAARLPSRFGIWARAAAAALGFAAVVWYDCKAWSIDTWTNSEGHEVRDFSHFSDYRNHRWREIWSSDPNEDFWSAEGGYSDTGKLHGRWVSTYRKPKFHQDEEWYWYGEKISEGEWHLRARDGH
jgi:DNA-directed RNA polymerase subunit RPC12/RpoP